MLGVSWFDAPRLLPAAVLIDLPAKDCRATIFDH